MTTTTTTTTTTVTPVAVLLDLHPSPSLPTLNHTHHLHTPCCPSLLKEKLSAVFRDNPTYDVMQLYVMTPSASDDSVEELGVSGKGRIGVTLVEGEGRVASFYRAKQALDELGVTRVTLLCDLQQVTFWGHVCRELLTPVHQWDLQAVEPELDRRPQADHSDRQDDSDLCRRQTDSAVTQDGFRTPSADFNSSFRDDLDGDCSEHADIHSPACTVAMVRRQIQTFLQTLPSLLGLPEVQRSPLLSGEGGGGVVHGFSTRRGGVTTLGSLCSMNLVYTVKKRDPQLVIEENRRRLSLAGGFDPGNFHIVRVEHSTRVWVVGEEEAPAKYDALVTNRRDVTLAAAGADCLPLLFVDPVVGAIGAAHAGWMGSVHRVAQNVVTALTQRFGSRPQDVRVAVGPGLRLGCFRVLKEEGLMFADIHPQCQTDSLPPGPLCHRLQEEKKEEEEGVKEVEEEEKKEDSQGPDTEDSEQSGETTACEGPAQSVKRNLTQTAAWIRAGSQHALRVEQVPAGHLRAKTPRARKSSREEWTYVDLQLTNYHVLLQAGVKAEHIDLSTSHCTKCNPRLYFSYERDDFPFGNQIGFISMPSCPDPGSGSAQ